jgi:hypothetical protein
MNKLFLKKIFLCSRKLTKSSGYVAAMRICDSLGRCNWSQLYSSTIDVSEEIDCCGWSNGFYFVKVEKGGKIYGMKILIQQ